MPKVLISSSVRTAIYQASRTPWALAAQERRIGDLWEIDLSWDTISRLKGFALPGETISETIERMFAIRQGQVQ